MNTQLQKALFGCGSTPFALSPQIQPAQPAQRKQTNDYALDISKDTLH
jgi:hypothetical protein